VRVRKKEEKKWVEEVVASCEEKVACYLFTEVNSPQISCTEED
jgi:hypothetical protein